MCVNLCLYILPLTSMSITFGVIIQELHPNDI